jgi:cytochrome c-type biogenesis protein CcmH
MSRRLPAALLALLAALALAAPAAAIAAAPRTSLSDVENEVMCVTCRVPLNIADSPEADRERAFIDARIRQGQTKAEIEQALVAQYGTRVLATPSDHGVDLAAWLVPGALVVLALVALGIALPRWRRSRERAGPAPRAPLDPADARRLDEDLARFDA